MSDVTPGRRSATPTTPRRRVTPAIVLAVLVPLLTLGALALVRTEQPRVAARPPELTVLTRVSLGCPSAAGSDSRELAVGSALATEDGEVAVDVLGSGGAPQPLDLRPGRVSSTQVPEAAVVTGEDDAAPGLLAARLGDGAATACGPPLPEAWFPGVGARPAHASVIELVNPDPGPAIADLTILAPSGPLDVPAVRGIRVPGRSSIPLDLARIIPRRTELAVQVVVSRGRLVSSVLDTVDALGTGPSSSDWLTPQGRPVATGVLLGLPSGPGSRRLTIANGGDDETRVQVRVISPESTFQPEGLGEIRIPPGSVQSVSLDAVLGPEIAAGATGLLIEATHPVSAGLRSDVRDDLTHAVVTPRGHAPGSGAAAGRCEAAAAGRRGAARGRHRGREVGGRAGAAGDPGRDRSRPERVDPAARGRGVGLRRGQPHRGGRLRAGHLTARRGGRAARGDGPQRAGAAGRPRAALTATVRGARSAGRRPRRGCRAARPPARRPR